MIKHKHYEIGVAKLANTKLVVFFKDGSDWFFDDTSESYNFCSDVEYFLCLPQHKEAVLNVLNGGKSEVAYFDNWTSCDCEVPVKWDSRYWYMVDGCESRIKPKKVKRVIGVNVKTGQTTSAYELDKEGNYAVDEVRLTKNSAISDWQFIEIEVEE